MYFKTFSFKDHVTIDNGKSLQWLDTNGSRRAIISLDASDDVQLSSDTGYLFINDSNNAATFINTNNSNPTMVGSSLGVGVSSQLSVKSALTIGGDFHVTTNSSTAALKISGGQDATSGSTMFLYPKTHAVHPGDMHYSVAGTSGSHAFFTNDLQRFQILQDGTSNFMPDGSTISLNIAQQMTTVATQVSILSTENNTSEGIGALTVAGGVSVNGDINVNGRFLQNGIPLGGGSDDGQIYGQWILLGGLGILYNGGNVGIGTVPTSKLTVNGEISALSTENATGYGSGGSLTVSGGMAVNKTLFVGNAIDLNNVAYQYSGSFAANNNVASPASVGGLVLPTSTTRSFSAKVSITVTKTDGNLNSQVTIDGINKDGSWTLSQSTLGDVTGIQFTINAQGQILYTSPAFSLWTATTMRFYAEGISDGSGYQVIVPTSGSKTFTGPLTITSSVNATSISSGGLVVAGGAGVTKSLFVGDSIRLGNTSTLFSGTFAANNNVVSPANVTGLLLSSSEVRSFRATVAISVLLTTGATDTIVELQGMYSNGEWTLLQSEIGASTEILLSITSSGQIQYTSPNFSNWMATTFRFDVRAISLTGTFVPAAAFGSLTSQSVSGNVSILSTDEPTDLSTGALVVAGGASVGKSLFVGKALQLNNVSSRFSGTHAANNNVATPTAVPGLLFPTSTVRSFSVELIISVSKASGNTHSKVTLAGFNNETVWSFSVSAPVGDPITPFGFSLDSSGQVLYTCTELSGWTSTVFRWDAFALTLNTRFAPYTLPTTGSIALSGQLTLNATHDATSNSAAALVLAGGAGITKSLFVGGSICSNAKTSFSGSFLANNSVNVPTNVTDALVPTSSFASFTATFTITVNTASSTLFSKYVLDAVRNGTGWVSDVQTLGDDLGFSFTIHDSGQIMYTSPTFQNWLSSTMRYSVDAISANGTFTPVELETDAAFATVNSLIIASTSNATGASSGALTVLGGASFSKTLRIEGDISAGFGSTTAGSLVTTGGNVGIGSSQPSHKLYVNGDVYATGDITAFSDARLKEDITTIDGALDKIQRMRGVFFTHTETGRTGTGVIAQEIEGVLPEVVTNKGEYKGVAYGNIVGVLIEAIKDLLEKQKRMQSEIDALKNGM